MRFYPASTSNALSYQHDLASWDVVPRHPALLSLQLCLQREHRQTSRLRPSVHFVPIAPLPFFPPDVQAAVSRMAALIDRTSDCVSDRGEEEASQVVYRTLGTKLVRTLGEGTEGAVYLAKDPNTVFSSSIISRMCTFARCTVLHYSEACCGEAHCGVVRCTALRCCGVQCSTSHGRLT